MEEMLRENKKRIQNRALEQQRLRAKKEKRKDVILFSCLILGFITTMLLAMKLGKQSMNDCMNAGHTQEYCEKGL